MRSMILRKCWRKRSHWKTSWKRRREGERRPREVEQKVDLRKTRSASSATAFVSTFPRSEESAPASSSSASSWVSFVDVAATRRDFAVSLTAAVPQVLAQVPMFVFLYFFLFFFFVFVFLYLQLLLSCKCSCRLRWAWS